MPKIRRARLPDALFQHLLARARERRVSRDDILAFAAWLDTNPEVPEGDWFKRFPGLIACGEGGTGEDLPRPRSGAAW